MLTERDKSVEQSSSTTERIVARSICNQKKQTLADIKG